MSRTRFLSFGAGVQTTAQLLMDHYDEVVFADTGGEWPETYTYMEKYHLPYCRKNGIKFTVVRGSEKIDGVEVSSLEEACRLWRMIPSRQQRWCTDRYKIKPIRRYVKQQGWERPAVAVMGISWDEAHRIHDPHWSEYVFEYPLVDKKITRDDCGKIIEKHGWPIPPKSGCFYCPFMRKAQWGKLWREHPQLFKTAQTLEENSHHFPRYCLSGSGKPLKELAVRFGAGSAKLDDFIEDPCDSGVCFV